MIVGKAFQSLFVSYIHSYEVVFHAELDEGAQKRPIRLGSVRRDRRGRRKRRKTFLLQRSRDRRARRRRGGRGARSGRRGLGGGDDPRHLRRLLRVPQIGLDAEERRQRRLAAPFAENASRPIADFVHLEVGLRVVVVVHEVGRGPTAAARAVVQVGVAVEHVAEAEPAADLVVGHGHAVVDVVHVVALEEAEVDALVGRVQHLRAGTNHPHRAKVQKRVKKVCRTKNVIFVHKKVFFCLLTN